MYQDPSLQAVGSLGTRPLMTWTKPIPIQTEWINLLNRHSCSQTAYETIETSFSTFDLTIMKYTNSSCHEGRAEAKASCQLSTNTKHDYQHIISTGVNTTDTRYLVVPKRYHIPTANNNMYFFQVPKQLVQSTVYCPVRTKLHDHNSE